MAAIKWDRTAVTLTELLVATAVIGIVLLGVVSADIAIRKQSQAAAGTGVSGIEGTVIMNHIVNNAFLADGSDALDQGFKIIDANNFCIRTLNAVVPLWVCYANIGGSLYYCREDYPSGISCPAGDPGNQYLGKVNSVLPAITINPNAGTAALYLTFTVKVPDSSAPGSERTFVTSVTPPKYRL